MAFDRIAEVLFFTWYFVNMPTGEGCEEWERGRTFSFLFLPDDDGDQIYNPDGDTFLVWAIGRYNEFKEPTFHHTYPKGTRDFIFGGVTSRHCNIQGQLS